MNILLSTEGQTGVPAVGKVKDCKNMEGLNLLRYHTWRDNFVHFKITLFFGKPEDILSSEKVQKVGEGILVWLQFKDRGCTPIQVGVTSFSIKIFPTFIVLNCMDYKRRGGGGNKNSAFSSKSLLGSFLCKDVSNPILLPVIVANGRTF